jgi:NADH dehydrogenase
MVSFVGRGRAERTATEQQVFGRAALARLEHGADDLVSPPGHYDAADDLIRRTELEEQAAEEARLTDAGERGTAVRRSVG